MFKIYATAMFITASAMFVSSVDEIGTPPMEDTPSWSCVDDGNRICGPENANGVPAGCYDDGGVMVAPWPCHVVESDDGDLDVYDGVDTSHDNV